MLLNRIDNILTQVGSFAQCRGCLNPIYWVTNRATMRKVAYNRDGTVHFDSCLEQRQFTKGH